MIYLVEVVSTEYDNVSALDQIPKENMLKTMRRRRTWQGVHSNRYWGNRKQLQIFMSITDEIIDAKIMSVSFFSFLDFISDCAVPKYGWRRSSRKNVWRQAGATTTLPPSWTNHVGGTFYNYIHDKKV